MSSADSIVDFPFIVSVYSTFTFCFFGFSTRVVTAWAKNDHLGFIINYVFRGAIHKFYPDFLIKLSNGKLLILEVKGMDDQQNKTKREYLDEWVKAVNADGQSGV